jgi:MFS family permease
VLALSVLTLINLINYLDRYVVAAIVPDLKGPEMGLTDAQAGTLMSAFMVVYTLAAPVFGVLGDRGSRTRPIAIGIFLWSLATVLSGFAANYAHLLGARALVGIGEAAYITIAPALLSDCFSRAQRGRVLSIFNMAIPVGAALGYIVGGLVSHHYGWRAAFFVGGAPGLLLALWVLRLPDPPRGSRDEPEAITGGTAAGPAHLGPVATYWSLFRRAPYMLVVLGYAAYTFALGGLAFWMPTFL